MHSKVFLVWRCVVFGPKPPHGPPGPRGPFLASGSMGCDIPGVSGIYA